MVKIKICGITSARDAWSCLDRGADALGFVFYPRSRRFVSPASARLISLSLPDTIEKIGVFVDELPEKVLSIAEYTGLNAVQLHGDETRQECVLLASQITVIKAFSVSAPDDPAKALTYKGVEVLFDAGTGDKAGKGRSFVWEHLISYREKLDRFILSGGLSPENVSSAIEMLHPYMVDVSSGVESSPGKKDPAKVKAFIQAVKKTGFRG